MSTNHTENYGLSQWVKSDQVQMEDFNADNAKIDAAIAERLGPIEVIYEGNVEDQEHSSNTFDVDLSMIDWNQWSIVAVAFLLKGAFSGSTSCWMVEGVNLPSLGLGYPGPKLAVFFPKRNKENGVQVVAIPNGEFVFSDTPFRNITALSTLLSGGGSFRPDSKIIIYGIR